MDKWLPALMPAIILITALLIVIIAIFVALFAAGKWFDKVEKHMASVNSSLEEIRADIKNIFRRLGSGQVVDSNSPIRLTELGQKISAELWIRDWARQTADGLLTEAKGKKEFEIYDICTQYVNDEFQPNDEQKKKIREVSYNHAIEPKKVMTIFKVELRDELLRRTKP